MAPTDSASSVEQARQGLGQRLREIRLDSGLLYVLNYDSGIVTTLKSKASDTDSGGAVGTKLLTSDFGSGVGIAVCN